MSAFYFLEWTYSPPDYFEETIQINRDEYEMTIENGKVIAKVGEVIYESNTELRNQLHEALNDRFLGVQVLTHKPYELSKASVIKIHPDGHRDLFVFVEPGVIKMTAEPADLIVRDKDGSIVGDTRRDRIEKKKTIAELAEKHRENPVVNSILNSYHKSVIDPDNELVHLYEIRDAMLKEFNNNKHDVSRNLGIKVDDWDDFTTLACDAPIKQGRHRGRHAGALRDATYDELNKARDFARTLIILYFDYLEHNP
jgi:hypothetical protein